MMKKMCQLTLGKPGRRPIGALIFLQPLCNFGIIKKLKIIFLINISLTLSSPPFSLLTLTSF